MKFLIIGGGSIGQRHIKNLRSLGYHEIYVIKRRKDLDFEKKFEVGVIESFAEAEAIEPDVVFICTPTALHNESLEWATKRNLNIFMEKPLIHSSEGLSRASSLLKDYSGTFFIGFMLRYHPLVRSIKDLLNTKKLGRVYSARFEFGSYLPFWHPWEDYKISYAARNELGGGVINTITHELDLIQYFFGAPDSVLCEARNLNRLQIDVEEVCEAIFGYPDKTVGLHLNYLQKDYDRNIKIRCDEGGIHWDWHQNQVVIQAHGQNEEVIRLSDSFDVNSLYIDEVRHFIELINDNIREHNLDDRHAILNTELMLKMHESNTKGLKVRA